MRYWHTRRVNEVIRVGEWANKDTLFFKEEAERKNHRQTKRMEDSEEAEEDSNQRTSLKKRTF